MAAVTVGELVAILGANTRGFDSAMKRASDRIQKLGSTFSNIGGQLTRAVSLPLLGIGVAATKASADWETAMVNVAKTVDAPAEAIKALGDRFVALSESIPQSSTALAEVGAAAGQLGIQTQNIFGFTKTMAALGVATNLSAVEAATALARLANITQLPQDQFDRLGATVVALGNNLATTEAEIVEMGLRLAGAGAQVGLTEAQILGLAGALSSVGIRAEAGGTAISRVMIDIASAVEEGGSKLGEFATIAGVTAEEFSSQFKTDAAGAIVQFIEGLSNLEGQGKSLFGTLENLGFADIRLRDALLRASGAGDLMRRSLEIGTTAFKENTALTDEASKFYARLTGRLVTLRNKLSNVAAEFGDTLRPAIDAAIGAASRALDVARNLVMAFGNLSPQTRKVIVGVVALVAVLGPLAIAIGAVITLFGSVIGTVGAVALGLGVLAGIVIAIKNNWFGMGDVAINVWNGILSVVNSVVGAIGPIFKGVINAMIGGFVFVGKTGLIVWDEIKEGFKSAFDFIFGWAKRVLGAIGKALSFLGRLGRRAADSIVGAFTDRAEDAAGAGDAIGSRIAQALLDSFGTDYVDAFFTVVQTGVERARGAISAVLTRLRGLIGASSQDIQGLEEALEALADIEIPDPQGDGAGGLGKFQQDIKDLMQETGIQGGRLLIQGLMGGMKDFGSRLKSFVASFIEEFLIFKLKSVLGIFSPSRVFAGFGRNIVEGLQVGMQSMMADLAQTSAAVARVPMMQMAQAAGGAGSISLNADFSRMPAPLTPREAALNSAWQDVLRETFLQLEQGGFRVAG